MIRELQWRRALALARAHKHEWSFWAQGLPVPESWEQAYQCWLHWESPNAFRGLGPSPNHTSRSGRISWEVKDDGATIVSIRRPVYPLGSCCEPRKTGQHCWCGTVVLRGHWDSAGNLPKLVVEGDYTSAHERALKKCLEAIHAE